MRPAIVLAMTGLEMRRGLDAAGYDLDQIDQLGQTLGLDLPALLAAWTPAILQITTPPQRPNWWRRFLAWRKG